MNTVEAELIGTISRGIDSVELTDEGEIIFTMTDGERINIGAVSSLPRRTLVWTEAPTAETVAANVAVIKDVTANPGAYDVRIIAGGSVFPALTVTGRSVIGISLQDGASLRAYQFAGISASSYRQETWTYVNTGEFDDMSQNAASQMSVAEYVEEKIAEALS